MSNRSKLGLASLILAFTLASGDVLSQDRTINMPCPDDIISLDQNLNVRIQNPANRKFRVNNGDTVKTWVCDADILYELLTFFRENIKGTFETNDQEIEAFQNINEIIDSINKIIAKESPTVDQTLVFQLGRIDKSLFKQIKEAGENKSYQIIEHPSPKPLPKPRMTLPWWEPV